MPESGLSGREPALITALTDAVAAVYGEWARGIAVVHLDGVPAGRWAIGGLAADDFAPAISLGIREAALTRTGGQETAARLAAALTDAVARVLGERARAGTTVELVAIPPGRTAQGGTITG
jgi:phenylpyruvate tautomerase PptA (4-oxalocrotonate tautomerase family)